MHLTFLSKSGNLLKIMSGTPCTEIIFTNFLSGFATYRWCNFLYILTRVIALIRIIMDISK